MKSETVIKTYTQAVHKTSKLKPNSSNPSMRDAMKGNFGGGGFTASAYVDRNRRGVNRNFVGK